MTTGTVLVTVALLAGAELRVPAAETLGSRTPRLELQLTSADHAGDEARRAGRGPATAVSLGERVLSLVPMHERLYRTEGWIGVTVTDELALLFDVGARGIDSSPDPARPEPRGEFHAAIGIGLVDF
jgi:hypothetical protein